MDWIFSTVLYVCWWDYLVTNFRHLRPKMAPSSRFRDVLSSFHSVARMQSLLAVFSLSRRSIWRGNCDSVRACRHVSHIRFFPSMGCLNHYFLKRRAMAIGIMVGGSSAGGL